MEPAGTSASKRSLTLADFLALEPEAAWPDEPLPALSAAQRATPSSDPLESVERLEAPAGPGGGAHPLELLKDLAERALRRPSLGDPATETDDAIPPESSTIPRHTTTPASSAVDRVRVFAPSETGSAAATPAMSPRGLAASGEPAPLDAGTLADLVNEALVEQARRHGVDLS